MWEEEEEDEEKKKHQDKSNAARRNIKYYKKRGSKNKTKNKGEKNCIKIKLNLRNRKSQQVQKAGNEIIFNTKRKVKT